MVGGVLTLRKLTAAVADPLPIRSPAVWLAELSCATVTKFLTEAVADPTWQQDMVCAGICVVDIVVYMGIVNNSKLLLMC